VSAGKCFHLDTGQGEKNMNTCSVLLQVPFLPYADISAREQFPLRIEAFTVTKIDENQESSDFGEPF
jgi:hypothetical protein